MIPSPSTVASGKYDEPIRTLIERGDACTLSDVIAVTGLPRVHARTALERMITLGVVEALTDRRYGKGPVYQRPEGISAAFKAQVLGCFVASEKRTAREIARMLSVEVGAARDALNLLMVEGMVSGEFRGSLGLYSRECSMRVVQGVVQDS